MITRKDFLRSIAGAAVGAAGVATLAACGDDGGTPDAAQSRCLTTGTTAVIATNHGHTLSISKEDVTAGVLKTYEIQGSSGHGHTVTITAAMFTMLQNNMTVMVQASTGGGHEHAVSINCA